jgi:hypothetical protein
MTAQPFEIGVKRAIPDARGNWTPVPAYEGWAPKETRPRSSWWLVGACAALVAFARMRGL